MDTDSGIYEIRNLTNGKRYIGSAKNFRTRWNTHRRHLRRGAHHSVVLQRAFDLYGESAFEFRRLLVCDARNLLFFEQRAFDVLRPEYNIATDAARPGLGLKPSPETRAKMSVARKGKKPALGVKHSAEANARKSARMSGANHPMFGKHRTDETKAKLSVARLGTKASPEARAKMSESAKKTNSVQRLFEWAEVNGNSFKGKQHTEESKKKISVAKTGRLDSEETKKKKSAASLAMWANPEHRSAASERMTLNNPFRGKKHTDETRAKMRGPRPRKKPSP